jgi:hypothetical protein
MRASPGESGVTLPVHLQIIIRPVRTELNEISYYELVQWCTKDCVSLHPGDNP